MSCRCLPLISVKSHNKLHCSEERRACRPSEWNKDGTVVILQQGGIPGRRWRKPILLFNDNELELFIGHTLCVHGSGDAQYLSPTIRSR